MLEVRCSQISDPCLSSNTQIQSCNKQLLGHSEPVLYRQEEVESHHQQVVQFNKINRFHRQLRFHLLVVIVEIIPLQLLLRQHCDYFRERQRQPLHVQVQLLPLPAAGEGLHRLASLRGERL